MLLAFPCEAGGWQCVGVRLTQPRDDVEAQVTAADGEAAGEHLGAAEDDGAELGGRDSNPQP